MCLRTPVALFIFNRPDLTELVFAAIARAKPRRLLVVADGPRHEMDNPLCAAARAVIERVDWSCEVETCFSDINLGCRVRVSSGLDWVFSRVEEAIILEDDCLPSASFFSYCEMMLERYRDDDRIMHIAGIRSGPLSDQTASYGFSRFHHVWGWASWRRAWQHYNVDIPAWPRQRRTFLKSILEVCVDPREARHWDYSLRSCWRGHANTWDFQWGFSCWLHRGLAVVPRLNLVSNIGMRPDGTHPMPVTVPLPAFDLEMTCQPSEVKADLEADKVISQKLASEENRPSLFSRTQNKVKRLILNFS